jgi:protein TonB
MFVSRPNWLLRGLIAVSLAVHAVVLVHISGLYRSKAITAIELTVINRLEARLRDIPRPRHRTKEPPRPVDASKPVSHIHPIPNLKPLKLEPSGSKLPNTQVERVAVPDVPSSLSYSLSKWEPAVADVDNVPDYADATSYLEMVKAKIERSKKYPESARNKQIQGQVVVRFVITRQGEIRDVEIDKFSKSSDLDRAALDAVRAAEPFPSLPKQFFKGDIKLKIRIVFELT